jgi:hypothetical protein
MDAQAQTRANLLQMALQRISGVMPNAPILAPPQYGMGGQQGMGGRRPLADLQPPMTSDPANVYGYPEGLPPEMRGVMNATQPFSRGMQGQMNMVDNMNAAYDVRDQLGSALRNNMAVAPSYGDMGTDESGMGGDATSSSSPTTRTRSRTSESSSTSTKPKAKASGASASGSSQTAGSKSGSEASGSKGGSESDGGKGGADNALSMLRKQRSGGMWDTLGTGVSLVQRSLAPEKGGLKSRTEYDRLLRGSDNFKKLDGDDQQRVRQAFAQWMDEQTLFKGKA